jgi:WD40 repeat protein
LQKELKYHTLLTVSSSSSKGKQSKITSIDSITSRSSDDEKLLVTVNDGKLRVYNLRDKSLYCVYRGGDFKGSQLRATHDEDGKYLVCPGIDKSVCIWTVDSSSKGGMVESVMKSMRFEKDAGNRGVYEKYAS